MPANRRQRDFWVIWCNGLNGQTHRLIRPPNRVCWPHVLIVPVTLTKHMHWVVGQILLHARAIQDQPLVLSRKPNGHRMLQRPHARTRACWPRAIRRSAAQSSAVDSIGLKHSFFYSLGRGRAPQGYRSGSRACPVCRVFEPFEKTRV